MRNLLFLSLISFFSWGQAQVHAYYQNIDFTQSPENIKIQLSNLVLNTHLYHLSYTPQTWTALKEADLDPDNPENVLLMYGYNDNDSDTVNDRTRDKDLSCHTSYCEGKWNREHVYPKSIGNFDPDSWPGSDVHSLRACDTQMNSYRYNYPFMDGEGNSGLVASFRFYPGDEWKGDVARMIMYMYLRYPTQCLPNYVADSPNTYHPAMPDIFLEWNAEDPVSTYELNRNDIVQGGYQGNRNPFIDNPYLATMIWGGPAAENRWEDLEVHELEIIDLKMGPNPTTDYVVHEDKFDDVRIYNMNGKLVGTDTNLMDNKIYLPSAQGLYLVEVCKEQDCQTLKILKK